MTVYLSVAHAVEYDLGVIFLFGVLLIMATSLLAGVGSL